MAPRARLACSAAAIRRGRTGLAWLGSNRARLTVPLGARFLGFVGAPTVEPPWSRARFALAARNMRWLLSYGRSQRRAALAALDPWPAHHSLWMCIHGDPAYGSSVGNEASSWANHDSGGTGHYGGLQMHKDWYSLAGYADAYSQLEQERAAEQAYSGSNFSRAWLTGQWGQTIGPCWRYAE